MRKNRSWNTRGRLALAAVLLIAAAGCSTSDAPPEGDELGRTVHGGATERLEDPVDNGAPDGISVKQDAIKWSSLLNPKWIRGLGAGIVYVVAEEALVWWYSSDYDWDDELLARAEMHRVCGNDCVAQCQAGAGANLTFKKATYTHRLRWRLFPSGWWYAFDCIKCDCEYECNTSGCGEWPDYCKPKSCSDS